MTNKEVKKKGKWTRRAFIGTTGLLSTGLVVGVGGYVYMGNKIKKYSGEGMGEGNSLNAWIRIAPDNTITLALARAEMGQGVYTSMAQMIAEELEVDVNTVKYIHPQPESPYANTFMVTQKQPNAFKGYSAIEKVYAFIPVVGTGGSTTVADGWNNLRYAGATAREMLKHAAAKKWSIAVNDCEANDAHIINKVNGQSLSYGQLTAEAAKIDLEELPILKKRTEYKIIGKPVQRLDIREKVNGKAGFGLDIRKEEMLFAAVRHPQVIGGKITDITNKEDILQLKGVKKVILTKLGIVAVVADNTWRAIVATKRLKTIEENGEYADLSTPTIKAEMAKLMVEKPIKITTDIGDVKKSFDAEGGTIIESTYDVPYLAHATMEPMNCTVLVKDGKCEAWLGHQATSVVQSKLSEFTGISQSDITVNITFLGGGFGRRAEPDIVNIAAIVAKEMEGTPVQTVFSREEDMRNDMYRPMSTSRFKAKINDKGDIDSWDNMMVLQSVSNSSIKRILPVMAPSPEDDHGTAEGADDLPYEMKNQKVGFGYIDLPIQVGFWRSVGYSQNGFFAESFMDECAHAAGIDPYKFRLSKLNNHPRHAAVLKKVAEMSNWNLPLDEGIYRGIALVKSFGSIVGEVAEIRKIGEKEYKIEKYYCAIDCGNIVNPNTIEAQMESGIIFGLSAALYGEITWEDGSVYQSNFPNYDMVRLNNSPKVEVAIMDMDEYPGGVGEPATPPAAPALCNALFTANGERIRSLPLKNHGYKFV